MCWIFGGHINWCNTEKNFDFLNENSLCVFFSQCGMKSGGPRKVYSIQQNYSALSWTFNKITFHLVPGMRIHIQFYLYLCMQCAPTEFVSLHIFAMRFMVACSPILFVYTNITHKSENKSTATQILFLSTTTTMSKKKKISG